MYRTIFYIGRHDPDGPCAKGKQNGQIEVWLVWTYKNEAKQINYFHQ